LQIMEPPVALQASPLGIERSAEWIHALGRCPRPASILAAAAVYTAACPPHQWPWAAWAVPGLLLVSSRGLRPAAAFLHGVLFAVLMSCGVAAWVPHAALEYFGFSQVLAGGFALAVYLVYGGIPYGLLTLAYSIGARRVPAGARGPMGAWLWIGSELLRANLFTGLPWELLGHTQFGNLPLIQIADVGGVYAVSFVMVLASVSGAELLADAWRQWPAPGTVARRLALPAAALVAVAAYGAHGRSLYGAPGGGAARTVAVVQGNVANAFRWKRAFFERTLATYVGLTNSTRALHPDLIVWPENAVGFYVDREPFLRAQLGYVAGATQEGLLVGGPRLGTGGKAHNAAYLIGPDGNIRGTYDKRRLVPFAEYDPLPWLHRGALSEGIVWGAGESAQPLRTPGLSIGTVICYEVLFPQLVRDLVRNGADVLVNLSNDSWLDRGDGAAPQQHFSMSIFRAIETRRYLVRASASGVSGFVSPYGETGALLASGTQGTAVAPVMARGGLTAYVRWGDSWVLLGGLVAVHTLLRRNRLGAV
jgi:apolipoprotein N-acyltransferase